MYTCSLICFSQILRKNSGGFMLQPVYNAFNINRHLYMNKDILWVGFLLFQPSQVTSVLFWVPFKIFPLRKTPTHSAPQPVVLRTGTEEDDGFEVGIFVRVWGQFGHAVAELLHPPDMLHYQLSSFWRQLPCRRQKNNQKSNSSHSVAQK